MELIPGLGAYYRPDRLEEALALLAGEPHCEVLAGGTDLLLDSNPHQALVDITRCGLGRFESDAAGLRIGSTVTVQSILESPLASAWADGLLVGACLEFGTWQVRNMATIGGNIAHALPAADLVPALMALDAEVELVRADPRGGIARRRMPLDGFARGPFRTVLEPGELVAWLYVPSATRTRRGQFRKVGRVLKDLAQVNCAVSLELDGDTVRGARIVLGAVHPVVTRVPEAENALVGGRTRGADWPDRVEAAVQAVRDFVQPITDVRATREWRRHVAGVLVERCLVHLADAETAGKPPSLEDGPSYCAGLQAEVAP